MQAASNEAQVTLTFNDGRRYQGYCSVGMFTSSGAIGKPGTLTYIPESYEITLVGNGALDILDVAMSEFNDTCPYCGIKYSPGDNACSHCNAPRKGNSC